MTNRTDKFLHVAAVTSGILSRMIDYFLYLFIIILLTFGGWSVWDTYNINQGAFLDEEILQYKPDVNDEEALSLQELQKINPDVIAWLTIDDTNIDYPVVCCQDNQQYLNQDIFGEFSFSGSIFLSCENSSDFSDNYSILYGHNMDGGAMFGDVISFTNQEFFNRHISGTLQTTTQLYRIELFAVCNVHAYDSIIFQDLSDSNDVSSAELISYIYENAVQSRDIDLQSEERLIAFSTCSDAKSYGRTVLFGRLK